MAGLFCFWLMRFVLQIQELLRGSRQLPESLSSSLMFSPYNVKEDILPFFCTTIKLFIFMYNVFALLKCCDFWFCVVFLFFCFFQMLPPKEWIYLIFVLQPAKILGILNTRCRDFSWFDGNCRNLGCSNSWLFVFGAGILEGYTTSTPWH